MSIETKHDLNDTTIEKLQNLIRANIDSYNGFHESAEEIDDAKIAALFRELGD